MQKKENQPLFMVWEVLKKFLPGSKKPLQLLIDMTRNFGTNPVGLIILQSKYIG
jgi:hypothetical protein